MTCLSSLSVLCSHYGPIIASILSSANTSATLRSVGQGTADTGLPPHVRGLRGVPEKLVWILPLTSTMSDYAELWSRLESLVGGGLVGCPFLPPPGGWRLGLAMT